MAASEKRNNMAIASFALGFVPVASSHPGCQTVPCAGDLCPFIGTAFWFQKCALDVLLRQPYIRVKALRNP